MYIGCIVHCCQPADGDKGDETPKRRHVYRNVENDFAFGLTFQVPTDMIA